MVIGELGAGGGGDGGRLLSHGTGNGITRNGS